MKYNILFKGHYFTMKELSNHVNIPPSTLYKKVKVSEDNLIQYIAYISLKRTKEDFLKCVDDVKESYEKEKKSFNFYKLGMLLIIIIVLLCLI